MSISFPCFNALTDTVAVMNCCVVAFMVFYSDILTLSAHSLHSVLGLEPSLEPWVWKHEYEVKL